MTKLAAIVVTYHPNETKFHELLNSVIDQVDLLYLVDNGSDQSPIESYRPHSEKIKLINLHANVGIAKAQNCGIEAAIQDGADHLLLLDHDSVPASDMVSRLMEVCNSLRNKEIKVAAVGPRYIDYRQNNPPPFIEIIGARVVRKACNSSTTVVPVSYLIASGSLIPVATLEKVGLMREDLFVDYVDIEWGLRASQLGYNSFGVCNALMEHDLGDDPIAFLGKSIPLHSPLRHYYLFRNAIFLYKQRHLPTAWKIGDFYRLMLKYGFYTLFAKPRLKHFSMMTRGMWDGIRGKMGKYSGI